MQPLDQPNARAADRDAGEALRAREARWASWMRAGMAGEETAYRRFLDALTPYLRAAARRRIDGRAPAVIDAEDVVQETLLTIHLKRATWDPERPIGPWIAAILRHKILDAYRRQGFRTMIPLDDVGEFLEAEEASDPLDRHDLGRMLAHLNERQRNIVRFVSVEGLSAREAAQRLNMSEGAVRVALHRALRALASLYRGGAP